MESAFNHKSYPENVVGKIHYFAESAQTEAEKQASHIIFYIYYSSAKGK